MELLRQSEDGNIRILSISPYRTPTQRKDVKVLLAEVIRIRENEEKVALIDDKIKTFPKARSGTGGGGTQVGPYPARTNCTAGKKNDVNNAHISQLNVELNTFACYYSNV